MNTGVSVAITTGGGNGIGINHNNQIVAIDNREQVAIVLAPATKSGFKNLIEYLERLSIHASDA